MAKDKKVGGPDRSLTLSAKTRRKLKDMNPGLKGTPLDAALKRISALERKVRELKTRLNESDDLPIG